jgi:PAS domain S-box-containing protein
MQLLDDVMRSRRELENTFDSISHLVAVSDTLGHIVHVNQAFAVRVGHKREELLNQPLADHLGPELVQWLARHKSTSGQPRSGAEAALRSLRSGPQGPVHADGHRPLQLDREPVGSVCGARLRCRRTRGRARGVAQEATQSEKLAALGRSSPASRMS